MARGAPLDPQRAWGYLLDLLARRDYTEAELRERLHRRGLAEADADALLTRLAELGLLNDARFAERWVESRRGSRGRLALRTELRRKGVAAELVEQGLEPLSEAQQRAAATALLERFAWRYRPAPAAVGRPAAAGPDDGDSARAEAAARRRARDRGRARAFAFLARRGFTPDVAGEAIEALGWWRDEDA